MNCLWCQAVCSNFFWGECQIAKCAIEKTLTHLQSVVNCSKRYPNNKEHGHSGEQLAYLLAWNRNKFIHIPMGQFSNKRITRKSYIRELLFLTALPTVFNRTKKGSGYIP